MPIEREQEPVGRDRLEQIVDIIVRDEVLPTIIKRPVRCETGGANGQNGNCRCQRWLHARQGFGNGSLDQPSNANASRNRDRNKCWQIVRIFVFRNFVAESVSQIGDHDSQEKPESRTVSLESISETRESQNE